jgi:DNA-binding transcriptional MocR family regulator
MPQLLQMKMLSGLTTSEINERAVLHAIQSGQYRRMLERLRRHLDLAQQEVQEQFATLGLQLLAKPEGGMFLSAGLPDSRLDAREVADRARADGILLAPSAFLKPVPAMRAGGGLTWRTPMMRGCFSFSANCCNPFEIKALFSQRRFFDGTQRTAATPESMQKS